MGNRSPANSMNMSATMHSTHALEVALGAEDTSFADLPI